MSGLIDPNDGGSNSEIGDIDQLDLLEFSFNLEDSEALLKSRSPLRLDKILVDRFPEFSRTRLQRLIEEGYCRVNDQIVRLPSFKTKENDNIAIYVPSAVEAAPVPEPIPLDIVFEDSDLIVVNKPVGMVVHPAIGHSRGTLVNALLYHCGSTLSGINGIKRPGIVHRLDRDTSGLIIVAKNDMAHQHLSSQLQDHTLGRTYHALVYGSPVPLKGRVETAIGRDPHNPLKMAVVKNSGRWAATNYKLLQNFCDAVSLIECRLETGRTHQIRVHMEHILHPLIGDPLYGLANNRARSILKKAGFETSQIDKIAGFSHQALHAKELAFIHPRTKEDVCLTCDYSPDLKNLIGLLLQM